MVTLVTASDPEALSTATTAATGAKVTVWRRTDAGNGPLPAEAALPSEPGLVERAVSALSGVTAASVLLVIGPAARQAARVEAIPPGNPRTFPVLAPGSGGVPTRNQVNVMGGVAHFDLAFDPVGRHVGSCMGEDRKVSLEQRDDIQNAPQRPVTRMPWMTSSPTAMRLLNRWSTSSSRF
ncbi:DUF5129 domain-containing protein [Pseudarthrobacter humi]|nr:DUF5129 domain-containing protein [Pseudarthrobacter humi]